MSKTLKPGTPAPKSGQYQNPGIRSNAGSVGLEPATTEIAKQHQ